MIRWMRAQTQEDRIGLVVRLVTLLFVAALFVFAVR